MLKGQDVPLSRYTPCSYQCGQINPLQLTRMRRPIMRETLRWMEPTVTHTANETESSFVRWHDKRDGQLKKDHN